VLYIIYVLTRLNGVIQFCRSVGHLQCWETLSLVISCSAFINNETTCEYYLLSFINFYVFIYIGLCLNYDVYIPEVGNLPNGLTGWAISSSSNVVDCSFRCSQFFQSSKGWGCTRGFINKLFVFHIYWWQVNTPRLKNAIELKGSYYSANVCVVHKMYVCRYMYTKHIRM
jgi:hypothetical protein